MKLIETESEFERWCAENKFSKDELARILGVTRQTIYNLTHAKRKSTAEHKAPADMQEELASFNKLPPMLSLSLFAIEQLGASFFGASNRVRKPSKRRI
jgi:transcriptional regulator with XRE-family HTH domain